MAAAASINVGWPGGAPIFFPAAAEARHASGWRRNSAAEGTIVCCLSYGMFNVFLPVGLSAKQTTVCIGLLLRGQF